MRATVVLPQPDSPDQAERLAGLDGERHIVHDAGDAAAARVLLDEAAGLDERERSCAGLGCGAAGELGHRRNGSIPMVPRSVLRAP